jgi:hypothetical protein
VKEFKYLGQILSDDDSDEPCVERNLKRAKQQWGMICGILSNEPASPEVMASFYKSVVQSVLLYGSESWVLTKSMITKLASFHRRCARYITGMHIRPDNPETATGPIRRAPLFSKQRDYGQSWNTFGADALLYTVLLPNDTSTAISVWHPLL